jgi:Undecaprenyl-phosphate glucose phosphotransferase
MKAQPGMAQLMGGERGTAAALSTLPPVALAQQASQRVAASPFAGDVRTIFLGGLRLADILVVGIAAIFSYWGRLGTIDLPHYYWWQIALACLAAANGLHFARIYSFASLRQRSRHLARIAVVWTASVLAMIAVIYFIKAADEVSRAWILLWAATGFAGIVALRIAAWSWLTRGDRQGKLLCNVAVVGESGPAERLARRIEEAAKGDVHVVGVFCSDGKGLAESASAEVDDLLQLARGVRIDEVAIAMPCPGSPDLAAILRKLGTMPTDVRLWLDLQNTGPFGIASAAMPTVLLSRRPLAGWRIVMKRAMDVAISATLLLLFAPLMLTLAALVKLGSPGPAIFRQQRFGFNKQPITVYKFRTMHCASAPDSAVEQARRNDPRVTRLGRFLRRSSLDELPQLFNVLAGNMSLVGPRPHAIVHDEKYAALIDGYLARHRVKPGITGWAQVNGFRGETDTIEKMKGRIEHDLFYIDHWSPLLDLRILLLTLYVGFNHPNAY